MGSGGGGGSIDLPAADERVHAGDAGVQVEEQVLEGLSHVQVLEEGLLRHGEGELLDPEEAEQEAGVYRRERLTRRRTIVYTLYTLYTLCRRLMNA